MNTKKVIRTLVICLAILVTLAIIVIYTAVGAAKDISKNPLAVFDGTQADGQVDLDSEHIGSTASQNQGEVEFNGVTYTPNKDVKNILLLGIDSDAWRQTEQMGWRSDMNMLCTVDFANNKITMTSIPRDTRTNVYHVDADSGKITKSGIDKINAAYSYGHGPKKFGPQNAMRCISEFLAIEGKYYVPIDYYISVDLEGVPKFASALDGIKLDLDVDFPGIGNKGDTVILDEENSRAYLENRKQIGGELARVSHEQQYLIAVAKKIKDKGAVESAPSLYASLTKFVNTNLSLDQIVAFASILDKISLDDMKIQTIAGDFDYIDSISYFIPEMDDVENKIIELLYTPAS